MTHWKVPQFAPYLGEEEKEAVAACVQSGWITEGPRSAEFVEEVKRLTGVKYGVLAPNGTLALYLALKACGIGEGFGYEVVVPDLTFVATATAVVMAGCIPIFADVGPDGQLDRTRLRSACSKVTAAALPVHLYGAACPAAFWPPPASSEPMIIEDACQALGVSYAGRACGSAGRASAFSFFADKTITTGEGGFVGTNDAQVYERLRYLRNQGRVERGSFVHPQIGQNFRMTDLQCAIGLAQLKKLPEIIKRKQAIYAVYADRLEGVVELLAPPEESTHIPFRTVVLFSDLADTAAEFLRARGVEPRAAFYPLHRQPCFRKYASDPRHADSNFPHANHFSDFALCLPTFPGMTEEQIELVCDAVTDFVEGKRP